MGFYCANLSFVLFRSMILGIICICIHWLYGYRYTVSSFVQYMVTIAKLNHMSIHNIFILVPVRTLV
jgi:hypothetical protein